MVVVYTLSYIPKNVYYYIKKQNSQFQQQGYILYKHQYGAAAGILQSETAKEKN